MLRLAALLAWLGTPCLALTCQDVTFQGHSYTTCAADPAQDEIRLFLNRPDGAVLGSFGAVEQQVGTGRLLMAMNAGMYHPDRRPVGYYVQDSQKQARLLTGASAGNFGLLPNGVFCIENDRARVIETLTFAQTNPACRDATQSGPMLVIDGQLHPRFLRNSTSRYIRNGVGTTNGGDKVVFAISNDPVSFYEFGTFFRDYLRLPQSLYFDGKISRLFAPALGRNDLGFQLGPIVGVVAPRP